MTLRHIAAVMGVDEAHARRFLFKYRAILPAPRYGRLGQPKRWPATVIEAIRALHGTSYDEADPQSDWLARFIQEGPNGTHRQRSPDQR